MPVSVSFNEMVVTSKPASVTVSLSATVGLFESIVTASTIAVWLETLSALVVSSITLLVPLSSSVTWPFAGLADVKTSVPLSTIIIVDVSRLTPAVTASIVAAAIVVLSAAVAAGSIVSVATVVTLSATIVAVVPGGKTMVVPSASIAVSATLVAVSATLVVNCSVVTALSAAI